jgi:hypothetical protein
LWIIDPPYIQDSFLDSEKPLSEEDWRDIFTKIGTVDYSEERSIIIFSTEAFIPFFGQIAGEFGYKFNILYWYRPNITSRKNTYFSNNIVPICILSTLDKLNYPSFKNAGSNQIICPAITSPTSDPITNKVYHIDEKPWALYWNIIRLFYSPTLQVYFFLYTLYIYNFYQIIILFRL